MCSASHIFYTIGLPNILPVHNMATLFPETDSWLISENRFLAVHHLALTYSKYWGLSLVSSCSDRETFYTVCFESVPYSVTFKDIWVGSNCHGRIAILFLVQFLPFLLYEMWSLWTATVGNLHLYSYLVLVLRLQSSVLKKCGLCWEP